MSHDPDALAFVLDAIDEGRLDGVESEIYEAIRYRHDALARRKGGTFRPGDAVTFNSLAPKLHGLSGVVERKLQKNILVEIDDTPLAQRRGYAGQKFRCNPSLMERETATV